MKKITALTLVLLFAVSFVFTACTGTPAESGTEAQTTAEGTAPGTDAETTAQQAEITVPDATLNYVAADIYADKATAEANGLKEADNSNISGWFKDSVEFDENWVIKIPDEFNTLENYVLRIAQGQYIEEVTVLKVKAGENVDAVKALAEYRMNKQKNKSDFKLYDDEQGTNAKMIDTGKVVVAGNFVIYAVTENTDVSIARAQKYAQDHPDCTSFELFKAIVPELYK